jgi:hypothetical protein
VGKKNKKIPIKKTRCLDNVLKTEPVSTPFIRPFFFTEEEKALTKVLHGDDFLKRIRDQRLEKVTTGICPGISIRGVQLLLVAESDSMKACPENPSFLMGVLMNDLPVVMRFYLE